MMNRRKQMLMDDVMYYGSFMPICSYRCIECGKLVVYPAFARKYAFIYSKHCFNAKCYTRRLDNDK